MENTLWTQWLPSHVTLDTQDQDQVQEHVRLQETGIKKPQHVTWVCWMIYSYWEHHVFIFILVFQQNLQNHFVVICPDLNLANGAVNYDASPVNGGYPEGTTASYSCNYGYSLSGTRTRTCHNSGNWDQQQTATCNRSNGKLSISKLLEFYLFLFVSINMRG